MTSVVLFRPTTTQVNKKRIQCLVASFLRRIDKVESLSTEMEYYSSLPYIILTPPQDGKRVQNEKPAVNGNYLAPPVVSRRLKARRTKDNG
jgi:hypothetical protein